MKFSLIFHTVKHLKPIQVYYQVFYRLKKILNTSISVKKVPESVALQLPYILPAYSSFKNENSFEFLNLQHTFSDIDWNYSEKGKLWTYNLNYFEFLNQEGMAKERGLTLISDFIDKNAKHIDGYEPYPLALRLLNWVKFLSTHAIKETKIDKQLYTDALRLSKQIEYHLLANHLIEDGFGLLFAAFYFKNESLYRKSEKILKKELKEQILMDGGHYELSPMYHQIILFRVLDAIQLIEKNDWKVDLLEELKEKASRMIAWMNNMQFSSGRMPQVNDATNGIAPETESLLKFARFLNIPQVSIPLKDSGYRKFQNECMELLFDAGQIAPSYQPGHSHADNLNVLLEVDGEPILVDTGISTYEKNERRQLERSTVSHNTISVNEESSSQVWSGFRIGKRAKTKILSEDKNNITAEHNGYRAFGLKLLRTLKVEENEFILIDRIIGDETGKKIIGHFHFHPSCKVEMEENTVVVNDKVVFTFQGNVSFSQHEYDYANGFNQLLKSMKISYQMIDKEIFIVVKIK